MVLGDDTAGRGAGALRRAGLAAVCAVTLGLIVWGVLAQRGYAVLPLRGVSAQDLVPTRVDGFEARTPAELDHLLRRHGLGVVDLVDRHGVPREITLQRELSGSLLVVTLLGALAFWLVSALALAPRIGKPGIADLFVSLQLAAVAIAIGGTSYPHTRGVQVLSCIYLVALSFMGPFFVRFSLAFPRPLPKTLGPWRVGPALLALGLAVALWTTSTWLQAVAAPGATGVAATGIPKKALVLLFLVCLALTCFNLFRSSRRARLDRERRQAKWILWGTAIGTAPYVLLRALPRTLFGWEPPWPPDVDRAVEMTIPLAFAVAVARERFLDIDVVIRRSILYTLLALAAAAVFFGTALLLAEIVVHGLCLPGGWTPWAWAFAGAVTGLLFRPARRWIGRWVDRIFFRLHHAHGEALAALEEILASAGGQSEVATRLCRFLDEVLEPKALGALVRNGGAWERCGSLAGGAPEALEEIARSGGLVARPDATGSPEVERGDFPEPLAATGVRLLQPIHASGEALGFLLVGEKKTERHYLPEDLAVLGTAAEQAGAELERLALVQKAAEEAVARRALAEISRQKAEFFARLAHDLRTPITAVRWSVENLLDGLPGPLTDRQTKYLEGVGAAAGQLARLVDNLVDLGRIDLRAPKRPDEPVDLAAVVREAVSALSSIARERGTNLETDLEVDLPPIRGRKEAAFQIVINLVDNALKYTAPGTAVEVALRGGDDGETLVLTVRDHGPGLPEDRDGLFELFRQGPESPHVQVKGFGIGLHIVRTWTASLGGSVEAEDAPGGGARFTCRLPRWRGEETTG